MKLWWPREAPKLDQHLQVHDEMLEASKRLCEEAECQRVELVKRANGHMIEILPGGGDAGKSGTEL